jgi:peptidoglycan/LPS O-acetylase OafA/YrhL
MKHQKRILGLDGIRGIAVIGVILYHLIPSVVPGGFLGVNFSLFCPDI